MARPAKPANVIRMEGVSHRTKAELEQREKGEKALLTGTKMRVAPDVKSDGFAYSVWKRVNALLRTIGKNDALYEQVINRYCRLASEEHDAIAETERIDRLMASLEALHAENRIDAEDYIARMVKLMEQKAATRAMLMRLRRMLMDIEKENVMTIAAALRAVPKAPVEEATDDPMSRMLNSRMMR